MLGRFLARRLTMLLASLLVASFVIFAALYAAPGNPVSALSGGRSLPPASIRRERPGLPDVILSGSPANPMGVAAMTLSGGEYAIHGTNAPNSIGGFASHGCIRMYNQDIADLYDRVRVGTPVVVMRSTCATPTPRVRATRDRKKV